MAGTNQEQDIEQKSEQQQNQKFIYLSEEFIFRITMCQIYSENIEISQQNNSKDQLKLFQIICQNKHSCESLYKILLTIINFELANTEKH